MELDKHKGENRKKSDVLRFIVNTGLIKIGLLGGFFWLLFSYLVTEKFDVEKLDLIVFLKYHLVWWPAIIFGAIIVTYFVWNQKLQSLQF